MLEPTSHHIMQCLCCLMSCSGSQVWCGDGYTWHVALLGHVLSALSADTCWQGKSELLCGLLLAAGNTAIITTFRLLETRDGSYIDRSHNLTLVSLPRDQHRRF